MRILLKTLSIIFILLSFLFLYDLVIRPWHSNWGATEEEIEMSLPGDDLVKNPKFNATRAITIEANPDEIYPWIIQIGYKRAGFYSYDWFDNSFKRSAEKILVQYQNFRIGDTIPISHMVQWIVDTLQKDNFLVIRSGSHPTDGSWIWYLKPLDDNTTRLITRLRGDYKAKFPMVLINYLTDFGDLPFMRKSMLGIKQRSEGAINDSFISDLLEGLVWILSFGSFLLSVVFVFRYNWWLFHWFLAIISFYTFAAFFYLENPLFIEITGSILILSAILNHKLLHKTINNSYLY